MKFFSILKLSLHNLRYNVLRTLLTVVVLAVVSFVIVFLTGVGYSFYESINANINYIFDRDGSNINVSKLVPDGDYSRSVPLSVEEARTVLEELDDGDGYLSSIGFFTFRDNYISTSSSAYLNDTNYNQYTVYPFYSKSNPFKRYDNYLTAGRMWDASDEGKNNVWLSASEMGRYILGDTITLVRQSYEPGEPSKPSLTLTVAGFIDIPAGGSSLIFIDYTLYDNPDNFGLDDWWRSSDMYLRSVDAVMHTQEGSTYGVKAQTYFQDKVEQLEKIQINGGSIKATSEIIEQLKMSMLMMFIVLGFVCFICVIIILLSIGSVANTIKISAEQNRRFFGVMKAIGMKNKSLRHILIGQIILMTLAGVGIASLGAYAMIDSAASVLKSMVTSMFYRGGGIVICSISPVIPVIAAAVLIGFVLLFTRTNLRQFSRMDVISVINEVN